MPDAIVVIKDVAVTFCSNVLVLLRAALAFDSAVDIRILYPSTVADISFALVRALPAVLVAEVIRASNQLTVCSSVVVLSDTVLMEASTSSGAGTHVGALSPSTKIRL